MQTRILTVFFTFTSLFLCAQSPDLLKSAGEIPKEFTTPSTVKFKKDVAKLEEQKEQKEDKKNKEQFLLESNFGIDDILQSGLVLFNDPATVYVNKVLHNLPFQDKPRLKRKNVRAYVLNTSAVNAFASDQGIIFVTVGLLANLQNEAELAFILAHEIEHIEEKHSVNKFIFSKELQKNSRTRYNGVERAAVNRNLFRESMYSKSVEEEADDGGLELFLESEYAHDAIRQVFTVLHYSYLPYEDEVFTKDFFEDENYVFPENLWLDITKPIAPMSAEEKHDNSTHPSSVDRKLNLADKLLFIEREKKEAHVLPAGEFENIRKTARYQIPFLNLYAENFPEAVYTAYLGLLSNPDDLELKKVIGKSLYMAAKYRLAYAEAEAEAKIENGSVFNNYNSKDNDDDGFFRAKEVEGQSQQVYHLLETMSEKELLVLATKYNYALYQAAPEDAEIRMTKEDLFTQLAEEFAELSVFSTEKRPENEPEPTTEPTGNSAKMSSIQSSNSKTDYWNYAFVAEAATPEFKESYRLGAEKVAENAAEEAFYESKKGEKALVKRRKQESKKGKSLGIEKVVVVNPFYLSVDERKGGSVQYIRGEERQDYFRDALKDVAKTAKTKTVILDVNDLRSDDAETFNDIAAVNQYFVQQLEHFDLTLTPGYNQNAVNAIADKYGTDYFLWTGVFSLRQRSNTVLDWTAAMILPMYMPVALVKTFTPEYDMLYFAILYDVKTGKRSVIKMDYFDNRDSKGMLNAHIYDTFYQISKTR